MSTPPPLERVIERKYQMLIILRYERQVESEAAAALTFAPMSAILAYIEGK